MTLRAPKKTQYCNWKPSARHLESEFAVLTHGTELRTPCKAELALCWEHCQLLVFYLHFSEPAVSLDPETEAQFVYDKEEKQADRSLEMEIHMR